jgi:multidrug efflux pump subunit AcrA (membrane-fusion protein)
MGFPNPGQQAAQAAAQQAAQAAQQAAQAAQQAGLQAAQQAAMQSRKGGSRSRGGFCAVAFTIVFALAIFVVAGVIFVSLIQNGH